MPIVSPADKWVRDGVEKTRFPCSRALIEVTRVLVQKRWQDRPANHNVAKAIGSDDSKSLAVALRALLEVWAVRRLAYAGNEAYAQDGDWISGDFHSKLELEFRRERRGIAIVINIKIGDDAQDALLFLRCDLFGGNLYRRVTYIDAGLYPFKPEFAASQDFVLAWLEHNGG